MFFIFLSTISVFDHLVPCNGQRTLATLLVKKKKAGMTNLFSSSVHLKKNSHQKKDKNILITNKVTIEGSFMNLFL